VFAAPISGITYGANGIWPWLRNGEEIENHGPSKGTHTWKESLDFDGSHQIGYLHEVISKFDWTEFRPANELLVEQPGDKVFNHFVSVVTNEDKSTILVYSPVKQPLKLFELEGIEYKVRWFDPVTNSYEDGAVNRQGHVLKFENPLEQDMMLILERLEF